MASLKEMRSVTVVVWMIWKSAMRMTLAVLSTVPSKKEPFAGNPTFSFILSLRKTGS